MAPVRGHQKERGPLYARAHRSSAIGDRSFAEMALRHLMGELDLDEFIGGCHHEVQQNDHSG
jgi:hypothetical protein